MPRASRPPGTGSSSTPARTPGRPWGTCTRTCSVAARWPGRPAESSELTDTRSDSPGSTIRIVIPDGHSMVGLLGTRDELLHVIERELSADIHVRGNEITVSGSPAETELVGRLFSELLELQRKGAELSPDAVERTVGMLTRRERRAGHPPRRRADPGHPVRPRPHDPAEDPEPEALRRRHRQAHDRLRHRPGRHRQDLPRDGQGGEGAAGQGGQPDHPDPPGRRGGRAPRASCPARSYEKIDPYLRPLYDALHDMVGPGVDPEADRRGHDRDRPARLHARPHASTTRSSSSTRRRTPRPSR